MVHDPLSAALAEFPGRDIALEGEGQMTTAVRVGDDLILRFPKHAFGVERLRFEVAVLGVIRERLTVTASVPDIVQVELDRPVGQAFVAHVALPGQVLTADRVDRFSISRIERIAEQVAAFLHEVHGLTEVARHAGVPERPPAAFAAELSAEVDAILVSRMTSTARERAARELAGLAEVPDGPQALCHTDIGGNILVDDATGAVAVIDFGSCFITNPALDVASLSVLGDEFLHRCASTYPLFGELDTPARKVRQTFALQDALYGARQDDWSHVDDVLKEYAPAAHRDPTT